MIGTFGVQMTVAVNLNIFPGGLAGMNKKFLHAVFTIITREHPHHRFIFISADEEGWPLTGKNIEWVKSGIAGQPLLRWRYWYSIKLPSLLKKYKADVLFSADCFFVPLNIPQCVAGIHPVFLHHKEIFRKKYFDFYKKGIAIASAKANCLIAPDTSTKDAITNHYPTSGGKVVAITPVTVSGLPDKEINKEQVKEEFTGGVEFFFNTSCISRQANIISLLKAFSLFKKRQKTSMKLVLAGKPGDHYDALKKDLETYKYKADVVLTGQIPDEKMRGLLVASYAVVDTSLLQTDGLLLADVWAAGVPVITSLADAEMPVVHTDARDITDIAAQLMLLYKDEDYRKDLIANSKSYAAGFSAEKSAALLWECIQKVAPAK